VNFFDREALGQTIARALSGSAVANAMIRTAARQTVVERYDLARVCLPAYLSLLRRLS